MYPPHSKEVVDKAKLFKIYNNLFKPRTITINKKQKKTRYCSGGGQKDSVRDH